MKQETGKTNIPLNINRMSIQLKRGGHSFSMANLPASVVEAKFVVLTDKTLLVPQEEFDESLVANYLRVAGMACSASETPVWSSTKAPIVAIMAADAACMASIRGKLGDQASFTSPLLLMQAYDDPTVWLYRTESLLYIKVYAPKLCFAEVVSSPTEIDVVYYMEQLAKEFPLKHYLAHLEGEGRKEIMKPIRHYFREILCE